jgi:hypothetical protein
MIVKPGLLLCGNNITVLFEHEVLRKNNVFGPQRDEVSEQIKILHNKELCDLYKSPNIVRVVKLNVL